MSYRQITATIFLLLGLAISATAGSPEYRESTQPGAVPGRSLEELNNSPIQDNSFLVEEAYNQEDGVVQHISVFQRLSTGDWAFTQTDEWPLHSLKHQLSVTLAAAHSGDFPGSGAGWGDTAINYRYQLVGSGDTRYTVAPRLSLLLPTGNPVLDRGYGGLGLQTNLPLSVQINRQFVTHWNVGATWVPRAQNELRQRASSLGYNLGQSVVWLMKPRFNALVETVWTSNPQVIAPGRTLPQYNLFISPGIRWAYNFRNGLQVVPGVGLPMGVGPSARQVGTIFYLSFEHGLAIVHSRR
jgi:hypothetical protein